MYFCSQLVCFYRCVNITVFPLLFHSLIFCPSFNKLPFFFLELFYNFVGSLLVAMSKCSQETRVFKIVTYLGVSDGNLDHLFRRKKEEESLGIVSQSLLDRPIC